MICKNCSTEFDGKFCPECGAAAEAADVAEENISCSVADGDYGAPVEESAQPQPEELALPEEQEGEVAEETQEQPRKKRRKGPIILIIILLLLIAAFCVTAFTDLIIPKQAQFVSVLRNMGSDVETSFTGVDSDYIQTKYSITINGQKQESSGEANAASDIIGVINSLGLVVKQSDDGAILSILEGSKELAALSAIVKDDNAYIGTNFSDLVFKVPGVTNTDKDYDEALERIEEIITDEIKSYLEKTEVVEGTYKGEFDLGMDVSTMTITLDENETTELFADVLRAICAEFAPNMLADLETLIGDTTIPLEISISALYDGAFSFARNSLGVSVVLDDGIDAVEILFFSNKKDKAIYGAACDGEWFAITDNYTIDGNTQSGKLALGSNMAEFDEFKSFDLTYTISENSFKAAFSMEIEGEKAVFELSSVGESGKVTTKLDIKNGDEVLATVKAETTPCEAFEVAIDTGKAVDISGIGDDEIYDVAKDFLLYVQDMGDSNVVDVIMALIGGSSEGGSSEGGSSEGGATDSTALEQYMWDEYGIEFYETVFYSSKSGRFVAEESGMIDVMEYGYDGDMVNELAESLYISTEGYTASEVQSIVDSLETSFAFTDDYEDAFVYVWEEDGYVVMYMYLCNLDNPDNVEEFVKRGLIIADEGTEQISFSMSAGSLVSSGYERIA